MKIKGLPKVYENFSAGLESASVSFAKNKEDKKKSDNDTLLRKNSFRVSDSQKTALGVLGGIVAVSFIIPSIRHRVYNQVNPGLIDISKKNAASKRNFIVFSDQVEAKRDLTFDFVKGLLKSFRTTVQRNFFSYRKSKPQKLTRIKDFPKELVVRANNLVFGIADYLKKMTKKVNIDYSHMTKS